MRTALLLLLHFTALLALPPCQGPERELALRAEFSLCHSATFKTPLWTHYQISPAQLVSRPDARRQRRFRTDHALSSPGATNADYRGTPYVKGHLVPAADVAWNGDALSDSFLLSNAIPQNRALNLSKWRALENWVRRQAAQSDAVAVVTGPIFCGNNPERIGPGDVAVPCQLFKVVKIAKGGEVTVRAFILPNDLNPAGRLESFEVGVDEVARRAGFDPRP